MSDATKRPNAPKLHGTFSLTRLTGAGVALNDHATADTPEMVSLSIGDSATNVAFLGDLAVVHDLIREADRQLSELRDERDQQAPDP